MSLLKTHLYVTVIMILCYAHHDNTNENVMTYMIVTACKYIHLNFFCIMYNHQRHHWLIIDSPLIVESIIFKFNIYIKSSNDIACMLKQALTSNFHAYKQNRSLQFYNCTLQPLSIVTVVTIYLKWTTMVRFTM